MLSTELVTLVPAHSEEDFATHARKWLADPLVTRYLASTTFLERLAGNGSQAHYPKIEPGAWWAVLASTGAHIGFVGTDIIDCDERVGEGYLVIGDTRFWRQGYATEAAELSMQYTFSELGLHRIEATCFADNRGIIAIFEKLGYTREGCLRERFFREGEWQDVFLYSILYDDYEKRKNGTL